MGKSYCNLLYHVIFSTKEREPWLKGPNRPRVHEYLGGIVRHLGGVALAVGGTADHVHLLIKLRQDIALADALRDIKANSSAWIHEQFPEWRALAWQNGYGAFTVSRSQAEKVAAYIADQEEHHRHRTFQEEFLALLKNHGIAHEERYLWE